MSHSNRNWREFQASGWANEKHICLQWKKNIQFIVFTWHNGTNRHHSPWIKLSWIYYHRNVLLEQQIEMRNPHRLKDTFTLCSICSSLENCMYYVLYMPWLPDTLRHSTDVMIKFQKHGKHFAKIVRIASNPVSCIMYNRQLLFNFEVHRLFILCSFVHCSYE